MSFAVPLIRQPPPDLGLVKEAYVGLYCHKPNEDSLAESSQSQSVSQSVWDRGLSLGTDGVAGDPGGGGGGERSVLVNSLDL